MSESKSVARRWAEEEQSNFETTTLRIPEGLGFYKLQEGVVNIDIIPYRVKTGGRGDHAVKGGNPHAEAGELYFQRTYHQYSHIGPGDHRFVAPGATFGDRDYIVEVRQALQRQPGHDPAEEKALAPKKRQLWLVYDHDEPEKGVQLWDFSFHQFGKLLRDRIISSDEASGWDMFWKTDTQGMTLRLTVKENKPYGLEVIAIDFMPRKKPLPAEIVNHDYDLDAMPIRMSYEKLKAAYLGVDEEAPAPKTTSGAGTKPRAKSEPKSKPADEPAAKPAESASAFTKGQTVTYLGDACEIVRILPDGILMLLTPDGDSLKVDPTKLDSGKKAKSDPVEEAKPLTAEAAGLEKNMDVLYQNQVCEIIKISPDGTSLTLLDAAGDSIRAVGCSEVKPVKEEKKATASKTTKPAASSAPAGDDADGWEQSWQEGDEKD